VNDGTLAFAFAAGMVATINPCGFAMLPAYLSYFLGMEDRSTTAAAGVRRALAVGLAVSGGFLLVFAAFGLVGLLITGFSSTVQEKLPWVTIVIGIALMGLGIAMLRGFEPVLNLPKLQKGTNSRELWSMFLFGVSYAISSLSCTIPLFLVAVGWSFADTELAQGVSTFVAYGLGMSLTLMALTLAIALARQGLVRWLRGVLPYVNRVAGVLLVLAGAYMAYYGWYEIQVRDTGTDPGGPAGAVYRWNASLIQWVNDTGPMRIGVVLAGTIVFAMLVGSAWQSSKRARR
jgi:cytochrome c-type biogenesis protein